MTTVAAATEPDGNSSGSEPEDAQSSAEARPLARRRPSPRLARAAAARTGVLLFIERRLGLTVNGLGVLGFCVVGMVLGRAITSRPLLVLVYGLLLLVAMTWLLGRRRLAIAVTRSELPGRVRVGQTVAVNLRLEATRRLSAVVVEEALPVQIGPPVRIPVPLLPAGRALEHPYAFTPRLRGVYKIGPLIAEWSDPFGLTRRRLVLNEPAEVIVHPATEQVHDRVVSREWEDPPVRPPVSKPWPTGFEFYGMRDYSEGDDPRRIVWRATARSYNFETNEGRILVRESEQGITDRVNIFLDTDADFHSPGDPSETFEAAVRAAASLGLRHLKDGFSVSFDVNSRRLAQSYRGERARLPFLDHTAAVALEKVPLSEALQRLLMDMRGNAHNVVVTPHIDQDTAVRMRLLKDRGTSMLLALIKWDDSDPATLHRAGSLGVNVVEITPGAPLEKVFGNMMGSRRS